MVAMALRQLDVAQVNAIALGLAEPEPVEPIEAARARERRAFERARDRLARRLLEDMWAQAATLDVGVWGWPVCQAEAERYLLDLVERGVIYIDPAAELDDRTRTPVTRAGARLIAPLRRARALLRR
jgi:hypothetical protein